MRLSEAILAGSVLVPFQESGNIEACAIGMALKSQGASPRTQIGPNYQEFYETWPWVNRHDLPKPCGCWNIENGDVVYCIWHIFDQHIHDKTHKPAWTLDQLCQWVESVDPTPKEVESPAESQSDLTEKVLA